ncbi:MAG: hypothetical protein QQN63_10080 [Nitrosopumilus sp.]
MTVAVPLDINSKPLPKMSGNGSSVDISLMQQNIKRNRGRPRNDDPNRPAKLVKWVPKEWKPVYEQIVSLDCMGVPQKEIAEKFNFTKVMISKICSTPQAKIIRRKVLEILAEKNKVFQEERFARTQVRAMERISSVMEDDALFVADPFAVVDRAFKLLEKTKVIGGSNVIGNVNVAGNLTVNSVNNLTQNAIVEIKDGLAKAREAKELHKDVEAIDVTSPIVERGRIK